MNNVTYAKSLTNLRRRLIKISPKVSYAQDPTDLGLRWKLTIHILFRIMKFDYLEMYKGEGKNNNNFAVYQGQWVWIEFHHLIRRLYLGGYSVPIKDFNFDETFFNLLS